MRQRVAIARALAPGSKILLLDEPFSSLDESIKKSLRADLRKIVKRKKVGVLIVIHDLEEALLFADRLLFLNGRKLFELKLCWKGKGPSVKELALEKKRIEKRIRGL